MEKRPATSRLDPAAVLVVSADPLFFAPLKNALGTRGIGAVIGTKPAWALDKLAQGGFRVAVIDVDALGGNAAAVVADFRKGGLDRAVFVAATDPSEEALAPSAHRFLPKPLDTKLAARLIQAACRRRESSAPSSPQRKKAAAVAGSEAGAAALSREILSANRQLQGANEALRKQVSQLTILFQMGRDISENENWSDALDRFLMALVSYTRAEGAALLLFSRNGQRLSARSNFQVDEPTLTRTCEVLGSQWRKNPRGFEIHSVESYDDRMFSTCLENLKPWRLTVVPLRYRSFMWGFLVIDKRYRSNQLFRFDYSFLTTIQTILAEEVANASYISDLRQLGRFNQKVLENIQNGVVTTDLEGYVVFWNHLAVKMCPMLATGARVHFDDLCCTGEAQESVFKKAAESPEDTHVFEVSYHGALDRELPGRLSITKMHDDNLNGTVLVGILEDLTEQKRMEAEIRRTDRLRVLGQVSAGMAHEIKNPLAGIMATAELLGRHLAHDEKMLGSVRMILDETVRLNDIVCNLQSFARPAKPSIRSCALSEVSGGVINLLSDQAAKKGIELTVREGSKDVVCMADPGQLTQVLLNLVLNAIDACDRGSRVEIALRTEPDAERTGRAVARIDVIDDGPGIPAEIRENLFEPFVTTKTQGTGLGLAISRQIIEEHNGDIRCDCLERGTRFVIRLPMAAAGGAETGSAR